MRLSISFKFLLISSGLLTSVLSFATDEIVYMEQIPFSAQDNESITNSASLKEAMLYAFKEFAPTHTQITSTKNIEDMGYKADGTDVRPKTSVVSRAQGILVLMQDHSYIVTMLQSGLVGTTLQRNSQFEKPDWQGWVDFLKNEKESDLHVIIEGSSDNAGNEAAFNNAVLAAMKAKELYMSLQPQRDAAAKAKKDAEDAADKAQKEADAAAAKAKKDAEDAAKLLAASCRIPASLLSDPDFNAEMAELIKKYCVKQGTTNYSISKAVEVHVETITNSAGNPDLKITVSEPAVSVPAKSK